MRINKIEEYSQQKLHKIKAIRSNQFYVKTILNKAY